MRHIIIAYALFFQTLFGQVPTPTQPPQAQDPNKIKEQYTQLKEALGPCDAVCRAITDSAQKQACLGSVQSRYASFNKCKDDDCRQQLVQRSQEYPEQLKSCSNNGQCLKQIMSLTDDREKCLSQHSTDPSSCTNKVEKINEYQDGLADCQKATGTPATTGTDPGNNFSTVSGGSSGGLSGDQALCMNKLDTYMDNGKSCDTMPDATQKEECLKSIGYDINAKMCNDAEGKPVDASSCSAAVEASSCPSGDINLSLTSPLDTISDPMAIISALNPLQLLGGGDKKTTGGNCAPAPAGSKSPATTSPPNQFLCNANTCVNETQYNQFKNAYLKCEKITDQTQKEACLADLDLKVQAYAQAIDPNQNILAKKISSALKDLSAKKLPQILMMALGLVDVAGLGCIGLCISPTLNIARSAASLGFSIFLFIKLLNTLNNLKKTIDQDIKNIQSGKSVDIQVTALKRIEKGLNQVGEIMFWKFISYLVIIGTDAAIIAIASVEVLLFIMIFLYPVRLCPGAEGALTNSLASLALAVPLSVMTMLLSKEAKDSAKYAAKIRKMIEETFGDASASKYGTPSADETDLTDKDATVPCTTKAGQVDTSCSCKTTNTCLNVSVPGSFAGRDFTATSPQFEQDWSVDPKDKIFGPGGLENEQKFFDSVKPAGTTQSSQQTRLDKIPENDLKGIQSKVANIDKDGLVSGLTHKLRLATSGKLNLAKLDPNKLMKENEALLKLAYDSVSEVNQELVKKGEKPFDLSVQAALDYSNNLPSDIKENFKKNYPDLAASDESNKSGSMDFSKMLNNMGGSGPFSSFKPYKPPKRDHKTNDKNDKAKLPKTALDNKSNVQATPKATSTTTPSESGSIQIAPASADLWGIVTEVHKRRFEVE